MRHRLILLTVGVCVCAGSVFGMRVSSDDVDAGFLFSSNRDVHGYVRKRAVGPIVETTESSRGDRFIAVRPFYSKAYDVGRERTVQDVLWPLGSIKHYKNETVWRILNVFGYRFNTPGPRPHWKTMVLPFFFAGRDKQGDPYCGLLPLGGSIHEFMGRDKIRFVLFPLYCWSKLNETVTHDVLWPLLSWTRGPRVNRFRFIPFYGRSEVKDRVVNTFVLWPFWTSARYVAPRETGYSWMLFPFYGRTRTNRQNGWTVFPPFFRWHVSANQKSLRAPWPFVQWDKGTVNRLYLWPLWGQRQVGNLTSSFFLWPVGRTLRIQRKDHLDRRFYLAPVLSVHSKRWTTDDEKAGRTKGEVFSRYIKVWPLFSYRRDHDASRLRLLDLWPARESAPVERNLAPLWTVFSRVRTQDVREDELLWGLYRRRADATGGRSMSIFPLFNSKRSGDGKERSWSILKGLLGYERDGLRKRYRLLYFIRF